MPFMTEIEIRIAKDIEKFSQSIKELSTDSFTDKEKEVLKLSGMYASDAASFLSKKDYYTAFASISYAHGLLDSIRILHGRD